MTGRPRIEVPQAFSRDDSSTPAMTIGMVATTMAMAMRKAGACHCLSRTATSEPTVTERTSLQK